MVSLVQWNVHFLAGGGRGRGHSRHWQSDTQPSPRMTNTAQHFRDCHSQTHSQERSIVCPSRSKSRSEESRGCVLPEPSGRRVVRRVPHRPRGSGSAAQCRPARETETNTWRVAAAAAGGWVLRRTKTCLHLFGVLASKK